MNVYMNIYVIYIIYVKKLENHFLQDHHRGFLKDVEVILIDKIQTSDPAKLLLDYTYIAFTGFEQLCFRASFSDNPFSLNTIIIIIKVGSRTLSGSEVEFFLILVNDFFCHKELYLRSCGTPGSASV